MRNKLYNLFWLCFEQGGRVISSLLITILLVTYLGTEKFGALSLSLAIFTTLGSFVSLGMDAILFKLLITREQQSEKMLETCCFLRLIFSVFIIIFISVLNIFSKEEYIEILNILAIGFLFDSFLAYKDYFAAKLINKLYTYSTLISTVIQLSVIYALIYFDKNIFIISCSYVLAKFIQCLSLTIAYKNKNKTIILPKLDVKLARELLILSYPMMLASSIGLLYSLQDQFFIKYYLSVSDVGVYAIGVKFVVVLVILPTLISNVFYPSLVRNYKRNRIIFDKQLSAIYQLFFILGIVCFFTIYNLSDYIISFLFGSDFELSIEVMKIYSLLLMLSFFQSINNKVLILEGLQNVISQRALLALIINGILNVIMIPKYGIIGAAYSTILSESFVLFSYIFRANTRFVFIYQFKSILLLNLFNTDFIKNLKL